MISLKKYHKLLSRVLGIVLIALVANHFTARENFPLSEDYRFPWFSVLVSIILGSSIYYIVNLNYSYYKNRELKNSVKPKSIINFIASSLLYITLSYIPMYVIVISIIKQEFDAYRLTLGLVITLLLAILLIVSWFGLNIFELYQKGKQVQKLQVKVGRKNYLLDYPNISYAHMVNKILYIILQDGSSVSSDFSIQELSEQLQEADAFQANRNTIITRHSLANYTRVENGKVELTLKPSFKGEQLTITISRYKRKDFLAWLEA